MNDHVKWVACLQSMVVDAEDRSSDMEGSRKYTA